MRSQLNALKCSTNRLRSNQTHAVVEMGYKKTMRSLPRHNLTDKNQCVHPISIMAAYDMTIALTSIVKPVVLTVVQAVPWETKWLNTQPTRSHYLFRALSVGASGAYSVPRTRIAGLPRPTAGNGEEVQFPRPCVSGYPPIRYQRGVLVLTRAAPVPPPIHQSFRHDSAHQLPIPLMQNRSRGRPSGRLMSIEQVLTVLEEGHFARYTGCLFRSFPPPVLQCFAIESGRCDLCASFRVVFPWCLKCLPKKMKRRLELRVRYEKSNQCGGMKGGVVIEESRRRQGQMHHHRPYQFRHPRRGCQLAPMIDDRQWWQ